MDSTADTPDDLTVAELTSLVREQQQRLEQLEAERLIPIADRSVLDDRRTSRRAMLRRSGALGAAAAGAVIGSVAAPSRVAAGGEGEPLEIGDFNTSASSTILQNAAGSAIGQNALTVSDNATGSSFPAALGGYGYGTAHFNGVYGYSEDSGISTATGHAMVAFASGDARSNLLLASSLDSPEDDTSNHRLGEIRTDSTGRLWYCVATGTPGTWKLLAGPGSIDMRDVTAVANELNAITRTTNSLQLIDPVRLYDSRLNPGDYESGPIPVGSSRVIKCVDGRDIATGEVDNAGVVSTSARGLIFTISIIAPSGAGFLSVNPSSAIEAKAATINWDATSPTVLNNTSTVKLGSDTDIRVIAGGAPGSACDFTIDAVGFYVVIDDAPL